MKTHDLQIYIEINGESTYVGSIRGENVDDACFAYDDNYLKNTFSTPVSIALPLSEKTFSPEKTKRFFEGLLPEGFTRRCVAQWIHADENDYLTILSRLGQECLGAIRVVDSNSKCIEAGYKVLTKEDVQKLAREGATESAELVTKAHLSLTGASGKVGLCYDGKNWFLPTGTAPSTHIVKQSHVRLNGIVNNELLCMLTAQKMGIEVVENFIVNLGSYKDSDILFATKRYDRITDGNSRIIEGLPVPYRLHQEDFSQALGIPANEKYEKNNAGYMKKIFDLIGQYSSNPIEDQMKLWEMSIFNYLIGNTDNHIKNISLLYSKDLCSVRLAPAYDIVSTVIYESSSEDMSMSIGGIYRIYDISRESFEKEAKNIGLGAKLAMHKFDEMVTAFPSALKSAAVELAEQGLRGMSEMYEEILYKRKSILTS
ncbi:MAG: HipA domain-containing protein [Lachnospiraceae bacterium]|nr:HipA domain-containing protein [Lachnospiraceae bacterium]